jgi:hypothetical protein
MCALIRKDRDGTFDRPTGSALTVNVQHAGDPMENLQALTLWLGVALYAAIGLFGVIILHDAAPISDDTTAGYGIAYRATPAPEAAK